MNVMIGIGLTLYFVILVFVIVFVVCAIAFPHDLYNVVKVVERAVQSRKQKLKKYLHNKKERCR